MIRVVVTGSESTGKTTLAESLAKHYRTVWVPEFARRLVDDKGAPAGPEDIGEIARGQMALEDTAARGGTGNAAALLIQDTDLLSTVVYAKHYYDDCPAWIERAFESRHADLYLLAGIDIPWVPDREQRDRGDRREEMHELFRRALINRRRPLSRSAVHAANGWRPRCR